MLIKENIRSSVSAADPSESEIIRTWPLDPTEKCHHKVKESCAGKQEDRFLFVEKYRTLNACLYGSWKVHLNALKIFTNKIQHISLQVFNSGEDFPMPVSNILSQIRIILWPICADGMNWIPEKKDCFVSRLLSPCSSVAMTACNII